MTVLTRPARRSSSTISRMKSTDMAGRYTAYTWPMRRLVVVLAFVVALPLAAQTEVGLIIGHTDSNATDIGGTRLDFHRGRAFGAAIERRAENASIELAAMALRADGTLRTESASADAGRLKLFPISVTARWHFAPRGERLDP